MKPDLNISGEWVRLADMRPSLADWIRARELIRTAWEEDPSVCRFWLAAHRDRLTSQAAVAEMQKRQDREWKHRRAIRGRIAA